MKIKLYIAAIIFSCIGFGLNAQSLSINYISAPPQGEFSQNGFRTMGGFVFDVGGPKISKFSTKIIETNLRGSFDYLSNEIVNKAVSLSDIRMPESGNNVGTVDFSNISLGLAFGPRFTFHTGTRFTPYTDLFGGFRLMSSERYFVPNGKDEDCPEVDNIISSALLQTGVSGGGFYLEYLRGCIWISE